MPSEIIAFLMMPSSWLAALIGSVLGFLGRAVWDRYVSDRAVSTQTLLEKDRLTTYGYQRLRSEAEAVLAQWKSIWRPSPDGSKLQKWPAREGAVFVRHFSGVEGQSGCPYGDPSSASTPLFARLETDRYIDRAVAELRDAFDALPDENKLAGRLLQKCEFGQASRPRLWILAPNFLVTASQEVLRLLEELSHEARTWIRDVDVVLEIYLAFDIADELAASHGPYSPILNLSSDAWTESQVLPLTQLGPAAQYAIGRSRASAALTRPLVIGALKAQDSVDRRVPRELLIARMPAELRAVVRDLSTWTAIAISGPPGAGKTQLANELVNQLRNRNGPRGSVIVIVLSSPPLLRELERWHQTHPADEDATKGLVDAILSSDPGHQLIPPDFRETAELRRAFRDALYRVLLERSIPVILVADDLHAHRAVRVAIEDLVSESKWGWRFVAIGRSRDLLNSSLDAPRSVVQISCQLWTKTEAEQILSAWARDRQGIVHALGQGWPARQEQFSLYMLRMIADYMDEPESTPSELLQKAVTQHLTFVAQIVEPQRQAPDELLGRARRMLSERRPHDEIMRILDTVTEVDPIQLFGALSWHSRFAVQESIVDPQSIIDWSGGRISTLEAARAVLRAGAEAGVFHVFRGGAMWRDTLVADGCAALYFEREIAHMRDKVKADTEGHTEPPSQLSELRLVEMVSRLDESGSIDILKLALDLGEWLYVIEAVTHAKPSLVTLVNNLVTPELLSELEGKPRWTNLLVERLLQQGCRLDSHHVGPIAVALCKLLPLDRQLEDWCSEMTRETDSRARLALAIRALQCSDKGLYFQEMKRRGAQDLLAVEMASRVWDAGGSEALASRLISLSDGRLSEAEIVRPWLNWCQGQDGESIITSVKKLIRDAEEDPYHESGYAYLVGAGLSAALQKRHRPSLEQIARMNVTVRHLARYNRRLLAEHLVRWVAWSHAPELIVKSGEWVIDPSGRFAVPRDPYEPLLLKQIVAKLKEIYPTFYVPNSEDLRAVPGLVEGQRELVRDTLPPGLLKGEAIMPGSISVLDKTGGRVVFLRREEIESLRLEWRPCFDLESQG